MIKSMFYDWTIIEGYDSKIYVVLADRGIGKTFGVVLTKCIGRFIDKGYRFVYVVETKEMVDTLAQNKGEKFFASVIEFLEKNPSCKHTRWLKGMFPDDSDSGTEVESGELDELETDDTNRIVGGTIKIGGRTAGYMIALNDFANIKRNNFVNMKYIIIDEFIPENIDIRHTRMPYKVASIVQSVARRQDVKIYMLGNTIRPNDILLDRLGLANMKPGEFRKIKDKYGLFLVCHRVDKNDYQEYKEQARSSVSGRFSALLKEDNLEKNTFKNDIEDSLLLPSLPKSSHLLFCLHGENGSVRINVTKDHTNLYVLNDYGTNSRQRICFEEKYISPVVKYQPEWKEILIQKYGANQIKFESATIHILFKDLLKLDTN